MVTEEETIQHIMERYNFNRKQAKTELQDQKAIDNLKSYFDEKLFFEEKSEEEIKKIWLNLFFWVAENRLEWLQEAINKKKEK